MGQEYNCLTEEEIGKLILSVLETRQLTGRKGATEAELIKAVDWAEQVCIDHTVLGLVLDGKLLLDVRGDEIYFRAPKRARQDEGGSV